MARKKGQVIGRGPHIWLVLACMIPDVTRLPKTLICGSPQMADSPVRN